VDCCQGEGLVWQEVRKREPVASYWGMDIKFIQGRVHGDSVKFLSRSNWKEDVIDIDTYGEPWDHWFALLPNVKNPLTVFLTYGLVKIAPMSKVMCHEVGLPFGVIPRGPASQVSRAMASRLILYTPRRYGLRVIYAACCSVGDRRGLMVGESGTNVSYYGIRLEPIEGECDG
jgi:hypothetical protein